jgi:ComF family protein
MSSILRRLLDIVAPRTCAICRRRLAPDEHSICTSCQMEMPLVDYSDNPYSNALARLLWFQIPHLEKAIALMRHEGGSRSLYPIYALKYYRQPQVGTALGIMLAQRYVPSGFFDDIDAIVPIPISPKRTRQRGYNQSDYIAYGISHVTRLPVISKAVKRTQFNRSQTGLNPQQRRANVANVFKLRRGRLIENLHILLVDDVITTGATMSACARVISAVPGVRISVASIVDAGHILKDNDWEDAPSAVR